MKYLILCLFAVTAEAAWVQLPATPPGTNDTSRVEPVPAPTETPAPVPVEGVAQPVPGGPGGVGVVGGMVAVPVPTGSGTTGSGGGVAGPRGGGFVGAPGGAGRPGMLGGGAGGGSPAAGGVASGGGGRVGGTLEQAAAVAPDCSVKFGKAQEMAEPLGGTVELPVAFSAPACAKPPRSSASWIRMAGNSGDVYRFTVDPNASGQVREGWIVLANQRMAIRQEAGKTARLAASPARVVLSVRGKRVSQSGTISVWAEDPDLSYTVAPVGEKWLSVKSVKSKDPKRRRFEIEVDTAGLQQGRHDAEVRIAATGVVNPPLVIPVVIEVR